MGSRRIGRKRLYALNKAGESLTSTAGVAIEGNIGSQSRLRDGELVSTDITIDLGSSKGVAHSFSVAGPPGNKAAITAIGVSSSSGTHGAAQLMQINTDSSKADSIGVLTGGELMCVEAPLGGGVHVGLYYGTNITSSGQDMLAAGVELVEPVAQVVGKSSAIDPDVDLNDKYLYLVHSGSGAGDYSAGKFVLRLYGYNVFDDVW